VGKFLLLLPALLLAAGCQSPQDRAVSAIKSRGGTVEVDTARPGRPVVGADLHGASLDDRWLAYLEALPELRELDLGGTPVGDNGLEHLRGLTQLESLNLTLTQVGDDGLAHLEGLTQLRELGLGGTRVTDAGLGHLRGLKDLARLNLFGTHVTDVGVRELEKAVPGLEVSWPPAAAPR
jgi:Leucine-rich repeat (LRR) protein